MKTRSVRILLASVAVVSALAGLATPAAAAARRGTGEYAPVVADEAYWISLAQVPDGHGRLSGAISVNVPAGGMPGATDALIRPFLASLAIPGLVKGGPQYFPMARAYLRWYLGHLQWPDPLGLYGTVCDYRVDVTTDREYYIDAAGNRSETCFYDSSDGYAGAFLLAVRAYAEANPTDRAWLAAHAYQLESIANVIQATKQADGLTWAKPDWPAKYLMDNVEAQQGLAAMSWLARYVIGDLAKADYWAGEADVMAAAIQRRLFAPCAGMYCNDVLAAQACADGTRCPTWRTWYPVAGDDSTAVGQTWPLWAGLGPRTQQRQLWSAFTQHWPGWTGACQAPSSQASPCPGTPWASLAYTAVRQGDRAGARAYLDNARTTWTAGGRPWPWTVADSGWLALAADALATS